jgi:RimJ/RimL family protein N-acetyltransferase
MIQTSRLDLIPATPGAVQSALEGPDSLAAALGVLVPQTWPPEYLDADSLSFTLAQLAEGPDQMGWWLYFVVLRSGPGPKTLIGSAGCCGRPTPGGVVEVGYGIVSDRRRQGFASEVVRGLVAHAFSHPAVQCVIAHTLPDLTPSIGVLKKCGFHLVNEAPAPGVLRFALPRESLATPAPPA